MGVDYVVPVTFVIPDGLLEDSFVLGKIESPYFSDKKTPYILYNAKGRKSAIIDYYVLDKPKVNGYMLFKLAGIEEPLFSFPLSMVNANYNNRERMLCPISLKPNSKTVITLKTKEIGQGYTFVQTVYFHIVSYPTNKKYLSKFETYDYWKDDENDQ